MADEHVATGTDTGLGGDDGAEEDREFGHGDQQFGGGAGDEEYGDPAPLDDTGEPSTDVVGDAEEKARAKAPLKNEEEE